MAEVKIVDQNDLHALLEVWKTLAADRPLRVLVCGKGGAGKSTLVNRLLQLSKNEKWAEEGKRGKATTKVVRKYERLTERGIKVCLFDTPGFSDIDLSDEDIIAMINHETEGKVDLLLYCISLEGPARVEKGDVQVFQMITHVFSKEVWKKAVVVLTFANALETNVSNAQQYKAVVSCVTKNVRQVLENETKLGTELSSQVAIVTAGHMEPMLAYEDSDYDGGWDDRLFLEALQRVDPEVLPSLLETHFTWKDLIATLAGGGGGAAVGALVGGVTGGVAGAVAGPLGVEVGAAVGVVAGAVTGAAIGGTGGAGIGLFVGRLVKIKTILKIKFKVWQLKKNSKKMQQQTTSI